MMMMMMMFYQQQIKGGYWRRYRLRAHLDGQGLFPQLQARHVPHPIIPSDKRSTSSTNESSAELSASEVYAFSPE